MVITISIRCVHSLVLRCEGGDGGHASATIKATLSCRRLSEEHMSTQQYAYACMELSKPPLQCWCYSWSVASHAITQLIDNVLDGMRNGD